MHNENLIVSKLISSLPAVITLRQLETLTQGALKYNTLKMINLPKEIYVQNGRTRLFDTQALLEHVFDPDRKKKY
jgi:hypothetical protein